MPFSQREACYSAAVKARAVEASGRIRRRSLAYLAAGPGCSRGYLQAILKVLLHARAASSPAGAESAAANEHTAERPSPKSTSALRATPSEREDGADSPAGQDEAPHQGSSAEEALPTRSNPADRADPAASSQSMRQDAPPDLNRPALDLFEARRGSSEVSEPHLGEGSLGSAGSLEGLVGAHLAPLLASGHSAVQERAGNVAALLDLAATPAAHAALHRAAAAQEEELRPVAPHAQAMVEVPPGLCLETSLAALAGLRAEYGRPGPPEWGPEARAREDAAAEGPPTVDEGQASEDARAAREAHRQRHGQYYLASDERAREQDTGQEQGTGTSKQRESLGCCFCYFHSGQTFSQPSEAVSTCLCLGPGLLRALAVGGSYNPKLDGLSASSVLSCLTVCKTCGMNEGQVVFPSALFSSSPATFVCVQRLPRPRSARLRGPL